MMCLLPHSREGECKPGDSNDGALVGPSCSCSSGEWKVPRHPRQDVALLLCLCIRSARGLENCFAAVQEVGGAACQKMGAGVAEISIANAAHLHSGKMHGKGTLMDMGRSIYTGGMASGEMHGLGSIIHKRPIQYKGGYKDGKMHGLGCLKVGLQLRSFLSPSPPPMVCSSHQMSAASLVCLLERTFTNIVQTGEARAHRFRSLTRFAPPALSSL